MVARTQKRQRQPAIMSHQQAPTRPRASSFEMWRHAYCSPFPSAELLTALDIPGKQAKPQCFLNRAVCKSASLQLISHSSSLRAYTFLVSSSFLAILPLGSLYRTVLSFTHYIAITAVATVGTACEVPSSLAVVAVCRLPRRMTDLLFRLLIDPRR